MSANDRLAAPGAAETTLPEVLASFLRATPLPGTHHVAAALVAGTWATWPPGTHVVPPAVRRAGEHALVTGRPRRLVDADRAWLTAGSSEPFPFVAAVSALFPGDHAPLAAALDRLAARLAAGFERAAAGDPFLPVLASSPSLAADLAPLRRVAPTRIPVLLLGETGSGKEVIARAVHGASGRRGAFVPENCAAVPETLLEAELFGVRRGAFTGATADRRGRLFEAHEGTLLLDEIGDLPLPLQAKLLRVLQEQAVRALGADRARPVDVRVIAATHRPLDAMIGTGAFRHDLFFRLAGLIVRVPPLRERLADLPYLAARLLGGFAAEGLGPGRRLDAEGLAALGRHAFPGNVRELENVLRRAVVFSRGAEIPGELLAPQRTPPVAEFNLESRAILDALDLARGVKAEAARRLGWTRQRLYRRLLKLNLDAGGRGEAGSYAGES